jgi:diguanylate cyclase (GGDEF)-like protein
MFFPNTFLGLGLMVAILALTAHEGLLRFILIQPREGKILRYQLVFGTSTPVILGLLFLLSFNSVDSKYMFGLFVIILCCLIFTILIISALYLEKYHSERSLLMAQLADAANMDPLTKIANRRKFFEDGYREYARSKRLDKPVWLLMIDIDFFKQVNDTVGHDMGDKALVAVSEAIKSSVRETDIVARLGGEEFVVLLADTDSSMKAIYRVTESIHDKVERIYIKGLTEEYGPLTVSIGVASTKNTSTLEDALKSADISLYQSKEDGRNTTTVSQIDLEGAHLVNNM